MDVIVVSPGQEKHFHYNAEKQNDHLYFKAERVN